MSKPNRDWKLLILDILENINKIERYTEGMDYELFERAEQTKDAVVRNLEIIGEASNKIPKNIQQKYNHIPWAKIIAMRNKMIHGYFTIDHRIVWKIIKEDLPELKEQLEQILKKEKG
jgi:uncharacterized protein with HEPN domain